MQETNISSAYKILNLMREFIMLTKPRVNLLIMFTAIVGMLLAHDGTLNLEIIFFASLGIGLAASAAAIINQVIDQKIDSIMDRTKSRPLVQGNIKSSHAVVFALFLSTSSLFTSLICIDYPFFILLKLP